MTPLDGTAARGPVEDTSTLGLLELRAVTAGYGRTTVARDVDLSVSSGSIVALLGPNGAGKTTLLRAASGLIRPSAGRIVLAGEDVTRRPAYRRSARGLCLVPEGRGIFPNLSVRENLLLHVPPRGRSRGFEPAFEAFPVLKERLRQTAGSLSGGQQQMLALSRCFLADPKLVLLDEVSMGLAPRIVDEIFEALSLLRNQGVALLIVEQFVSRALRAADHVYLLSRGQITFSGPPSAVDEDELIHRYVGGEKLDGVDTL